MVGAGFLFSGLQLHRTCCGPGSRARPYPPRESWADFCATCAALQICSTQPSMLPEREAISHFLGIELATVIPLGECNPVSSLF